MKFIVKISELIMRIGAAFDFFKIILIINFPKSLPIVKIVRDEGFDAVAFIHHLFQELVVVHFFLSILQDPFILTKIKEEIF